MKNVDPFVLTPGPRKWLNRVDLKIFDLSDLEDTEKSQKNQSLSLNLQIKWAREGAGEAASPPNPFYHVRAGHERTDVSTRMSLDLDDVTTMETSYGNLVG